MKRKSIHQAIEEQEALKNEALQSQEICQKCIAMADYALSILWQLERDETAHKPPKEKENEHHNHEFEPQLNATRPDDHSPTSTPWHRTKTKQQVLPPDEQSLDLNRQKNRSTSH